MTTTPIVLVPGFWLGAWAWDEVAAALRADGHDVTAVTLPGLESVDADRSAVTAGRPRRCDLRRRRARGRPRRAGRAQRRRCSGYGASDRVPEQIAHMVYVDSAPRPPRWTPASRAPSSRCLPREDFADGENLDGFSDEHRATFHRRAVPEPAAASRGAGAHERRPARRPVHGHLHRDDFAGVPGRGRPRARPGWAA